jgi:group I intron endonuclease
MIIYLAKNTVNGKCYVGCTSLTLEKRRQQHFDITRKVDSAFRNAIKKYGTIAFEWEILETCFETEVMFQREKFWIKELNTISPNGYNMTFGGEGGKLSPDAIESKLGRKASDETKLKMSLARIGKKMPSEFGEAIRQRILGSKLSEETKKKISDSQRGKPGRRLGKKVSNEGRLNISLGHRKPIPSFCIDRIGEQL